MFVGICDRRVYWMNRLLHYTPILSGERALRRAGLGTGAAGVPAQLPGGDRAQLLRQECRRTHAPCGHAGPPADHQGAQAGSLAGPLAAHPDDPRHPAGRGRLYLLQNARLLLGAPPVPPLEPERFKSGS
ncbi:MAG: hypothetical protein HC872_07315 [Gammaproteobacteria bacterium]|nr:hypothetical protein [Gammaproteobacteria bacterium]